MLPQQPGKDPGHLAGQKAAHVARQAKHAYALSVGVYILLYKEVGRLRRALTDARFKRCLSSNERERERERERELSLIHI